MWQALLGQGISDTVNLAADFFQNKENADHAEDNRDFQAGMSNTAYQRAMTDMKAAGLNPILAYRTGGASTPSGTSVQMQNLHRVDNLANTLATAQQMKVQKAQMHKVSEEARLLTEKVNTEFDMQQKLNSDKALSDQLTAKAMQETNSASNANKIMEIKADYLSKNPAMIEAEIWADLLNKSAGAASGLMDLVPSLRRLLFPVGKYRPIKGGDNLPSYLKKGK